jgi:hypothetical protein
MPNLFDFLGDDKDFFMKSSWMVYADLNGNRQYVGKTSNEKTLSPALETIEWHDNASGVQTLFVTDITKAGLSVSFSFMQIADPNALALFLNGEWDKSNPNKHYIYMGSNPPELESAEWRFVAQSRSGLVITLVIREGACYGAGDWTSGGAGDYAALPVIVKAQQDTTITDTKRDLAYFMIDKKAYS